LVNLENQSLRSNQILHYGGKLYLFNELQHPPALYFQLSVAILDFLIFNFSPVSIVSAAPESAHIGVLQAKYFFTVS